MPHAPKIEKCLVIQKQHGHINNILHTLFSDEEFARYTDGGCSCKA